MPRRKIHSLSDPEVFAISRVKYRELRARLRDLPLSHTTIRVYDYIVDEFRRNGISPTIKDIAAALAQRSESSVVNSIIELVQADWLEPFRKAGRQMYRPKDAPHGEKVRDFYEWYRAYYLEHGILPSYRACADKLNYKSIYSINQMMKVLVENGYVEQVMTKDGLHGQAKYVPTDTIVVDKREYDALKRAYKLQKAGLSPHWG